MDTLYWNNLNSKIQFESTVKKFYNQYLWRMVINAQGGKLLESKTTDLQLALDYRLQVSRIYNPGSWYYSYKQQQDLSKVDIGLLESVRSIKLLFSGQIKTRVEEPKIQFYASSESVLKLIAQELDNSICIESVTGPDSNAEQLLESGVIISKNPVDYEIGRAHV